MRAAPGHNRHYAVGCCHHPAAHCLVSLSLPPACSQVYVQDLIQANGAQLYPLFEAGAVVYVCGDARRMVRLPVCSLPCDAVFLFVMIIATCLPGLKPLALRPLINRRSRGAAVVLLSVGLHPRTLPVWTVSQRLVLLLPTACSVAPVVCCTAVYFCPQAPDVRAAFKDVARTYGGRPDAAVDSWLGGLLEGGRYLEDVWAG